MKKVAYFGYSYVSGALKRARAYVQHNPEFEHTYVTVDDFILNSHWFKTTEKEQIFFNERNIPFVRAQDVKSSDFDIVVLMSDKAFQEYIEFTGKTGIKNVCDKEILTREAQAFGFSVPKTSGFTTNDFIIIKPKLSSGGHAEETFCYRKIRYHDNFKFFNSENRENYLVQEFIDTDRVIQFNFVIGKLGVTPNGVFDFQFSSVDGGKVTPVYMVSYPTAEKFVSYVEEYSLSSIKALQEMSMRFLISQGYGELPGFYTVQFLPFAGKFYIHDINLRIGPGAVEAGLRHLFDSNLFSNLKTMLGIAKLEDLPHDDNLAYAFYLEKNGERLIHTAKKFEEDYVNRIRCTENKNSGFIRSDYETYLQILKI